jgi:hypothetical protein
MCKWPLEQYGLISMINKLIDEFCFTFFQQVPNGFNNIRNAFPRAPVFVI